ncbi:MAG: glycerol-3-phosphate 1-O-acyltransferase PlsY [Phycisphaerales bacterium]|jgi:glycerol-3-phosphate acyltransferase PlsY|nr:glycerol-3-phosphate 1-O-acyltransferase PlsY [Phycisphaerales bacterium]
MSWALFIAGAYLIGSIPFGVIIAKAKGVDITAHGSGNIGATNVGRVLGRRLGLTCFLLDVGKGAGPVLIAGASHDLLGRWATEITASASWLWLAVAVAALTGHMASVFLGFRGGKGVATAFGGLAAMWPTLGIPAVIALGCWIAVVACTRIVSAASMAAAIALPAATLALLLTTAPGEEAADITRRLAPPIIVSFGIAGLVLWRHRTNIGRLLKGTEHRIGRR